MIDREQAIKPFNKIPQGAPFWKYNVKDDVITASVKSFNFSKIMESSQSGKKYKPKKSL